VLLEILRAMREKHIIRFENQSTRSGRDSVLAGVPVKIFTSAVTGRRYVCVYNTVRGRFLNHRLDYVKSVESFKVCEEYDEIKAALERNIGHVWGVSFGGKSHKELLYMKLYVDEKTEGYILNRLQREGRGGEILRLDEDIYLYTKELYDTNEMASWIKTFTGRIIALEGTNCAVINKFYRDMERMQEMYAGSPLAVGEVEA